MSYSPIDMFLDLYDDWSADDMYDVCLKVAVLSEKYGPCFLPNAEAVFARLAEFQVRFGTDVSDGEWKGSAADHAEVMYEVLNDAGFEPKQSRAQEIINLARNGNWGGARNRITNVPAQDHLTLVFDLINADYETGENTYAEALTFVQKLVCGG